MGDPVTGYVIYYQPEGGAVSSDMVSGGETETHLLETTGPVEPLRLLRLWPDQLLAQSWYCTWFGGPRGPVQSGRDPTKLRKSGWGMITGACASWPSRAYTEKDG